MAPESLCLHEGRLESSWGAWAGKRVIYIRCTYPPGAPAPVPGTCHLALCGDSIGILVLAGGVQVCQRASWEGQVLHCCLNNLSALLIEEGLLGWSQGSFWPHRLM